MSKLIWTKWPVIDSNSFKFTSSGLMNGRFSISGNEYNSTSFIRVAEKKMETFTGANHSILTSNGSASILLALQNPLILGKYGHSHRQHQQFCQSFYPLACA